MNDGSIDIVWLTGHIFLFSAGDEKEIISNKFVFEQDGRISGYYNANERRWSLRDNCVFLERDDGTVTAKLLKVPAADGSFFLSGPFLLVPNGRLHHLSPIGVRTDRTTVSSYDLFDTLVTRKCYWPNAIHHNVEKKSRIEGFARHRIEVEQKLWASGDYTFDDIYEKLSDSLGAPENIINELKILELSEEWNNLFAIEEMVKCVRSTDVIISDMYLPRKFIQSILSQKCGLSNVELILTSHGKHRGEIWPLVKSKFDIICHYGDNMRSDFESPTISGIKAQHTSVHKWTVTEEILNGVGLSKFAQTLRYSRLSSYVFDRKIKEAYLAQYEANIPLLLVMGILLLKQCRQRSVDTLLMCGRDCNLWVILVRFLVSISNYRIDVKYISSSREAFIKSTDSYRAYIRSFGGQKIMIADLSGTGRTPSKFINDCSATDYMDVFIAMKSNIVAPIMDKIAPFCETVNIIFGLETGDDRFIFERLNSSIEQRVLDIEFIDGEFKPIVDNLKLTDDAYNMICAMNEAFNSTIARFREDLIPVNFDQYDDNSLTIAAKKIIEYAKVYDGFSNILPD